MGQGAGSTDSGPKTNTRGASSRRQTERTVLPSRSRASHVLARAGFKKAKHKPANRRICQRHANDIASCQQYCISMPAGPPRPPARRRRHCRRRRPPRVSRSRETCHHLEEQKPRLAVQPSAVNESVSGVSECESVDESQCTVQVQLCPILVTGHPLFKRDGPSERNGGCSADGCAITAAASYAASASSCRAASPAVQPWPSSPAAAARASTAASSRTAATNFATAAASGPSSLPSAASAGRSSPARSAAQPAARVLPGRRGCWLPSPAAPATRRGEPATGAAGEVKPSTTWWGSCGIGRTPVNPPHPPPPVCSDMPHQGRGVLW